MGSCGGHQTFGGHEHPDTPDSRRSRRKRKKCPHNEFACRHAVARCGPSPQLHSLRAVEEGIAAEAVGIVRWNVVAGSRDGETVKALAEMVAAWIAGAVRCNRGAERLDRLERKEMRTGGGDTNDVDRVERGAARNSRMWKRSERAWELRASTSCWGRRRTRTWRTKRSRCPKWKMRLH